MPLADARTTRVCEHGAAEGFEFVELTIACNRCADLFRTRCHEERDDCLQPMGASLRGDIGGAAHVLVRRVRAAADERGGNGFGNRVAGAFEFARELRERSCTIGRMWPDNV